MTRHGFVPAETNDRCVTCRNVFRHPQHFGQRPPPVCRRTKSHAGHSNCAGVDFPTEVRVR